MFRSLASKFKRWQDAGLISADQADAILAFEKNHKAGKLVKDLGNVGIFAILVGIVSLVASNWADIPPFVKLLGHFLLNAGVAGFMLRQDEIKHPLIKDGLVVALFGLFLTFIALIGQVYQLHGELHETLLYWLVICTPFIWFYGRSYTVIGPWLLIAVVTLYLNIDAALEHMPHRFLLISSVISLYLSPVLLLIARSEWLKRARPGFVKSFHQMGLCLPGLFANIGIFMFYDSWRTIEHQTIQMVLMAIGLLGIFVLFRPRKDDRQASVLWYYLLFSSILMMMPFAVPGVESGLVSAILFALYWIFLAWVGAQIHDNNLSDWAIRLVILRIFVVYLEVFGSLLTTGIGLIVSGIILLVILRYLNRIVAAGRRLLNYEII
jgi:uncharacterized membrane protein